MEGKGVFRKISFDLKEVDIGGSFFTNPSAPEVDKDTTFFRDLVKALKRKEGDISAFYDIWGEEIAQQCRSSADMGIKAEELRKRICKLRGLEGNLLEIAQRHQPENNGFHELLRTYGRGGEDIVFEKEEVAVSGAGAGSSPAPKPSGLSLLFGRPKANSV